MEYLIKRGDAEFGPYSLAGLQHYLQEGQLFKDDLTRSEGMTEWVPLSQVLGTVPVPQAPATGSGNATQVVESPERFVKPAPNLPWWVLLILSFLMRIFLGALWAIPNIIWGIVLGNWARKLSGKNNSLVLVAMYPAAIVSSILLGALGAASGEGTVAVGVAGLLFFAGLILYVMGLFSIRSDMEHYYNSVERIGLSLSGPMVFFFGIIYLQYHVNSITDIRKSLGRD